MNKCKNVSLTAARMTFRVQALNRAPCCSYRRIHPPLRKLHLYRRGQVNFKNVILTEHGKHKKSASYGAWEAHFWVLQHLRSETTNFFRHYLRRGVSKKAKCDTHDAWESTKKKLLTEHGKQIFHFCNHSRMILTFLPELVRFWPVLAGFPAVLGQSGPIWRLPTRAGGQDDGS